LKRQFLHAYSLELRCYPDNALCRFVAPLANDLSVWLERYFPVGLEVIHASKTLSA
jgi:23S rRNA pseudouridine1911/1915/1917 synthase